jgi:N6-adenosine-specific RNA methylase IME4
MLSAPDAKPSEFYDIIESMYDHGRKLELFARAKPRDGWDRDGNEVGRTPDLD